MNYNTLKKAELIEVIKMNDCSIEQLNKEIQELKNNRAYQSEIIENLEETHKNDTISITKLIDDKTHQSKIIRDLEEKHKTYANTINQLRIDKENLAQIIDSRNKDIKNLKLVIESLNKDVANQKTIIEKLEKRHNDDISVINNFKNTNTELFNKWSTVNDELESCMCKLDKSTQMINNKLQIIKELRKENLIYKVSTIVFSIIMLFMMMC